MSSHSLSRTGRSSITPTTKSPFKMKGKKSLLKSMKSLFSNKKTSKQEAKTEGQSTLKNSEREPKDARDRAPVDGLSYMRHAESEDFLESNRFAVVADTTTNESRSTKSDSGEAPISRANGSSDNHISQTTGQVLDTSRKIEDVICENDQNKRNEKLENVSRDVTGQDGENKPCNTDTVSQFMEPSTKPVIPIEDSQGSDVKTGTESEPQEIESQSDDLPEKPLGFVKRQKWFSIEGSRLKYIVLSLLAVLISITLAMYLSWESSDRDSHTRSDSTETDSDGARRQTYMAYIYVGLLASASGVTVWYVWAWYAEKQREHKRKEREEQMKKCVTDAKRKAMKNDANILGGILILVVCISMPIMAFGAIMNALGKTLSSLDKVIDILGHTRPEDRAGGSRSLSGQSRSERASDGQHGAGSGPGNHGDRQYKISLGRTLLMIFVPILIPIIFWKARSQERKTSVTSQSPQVTSQSKKTSHSQSNSIIKSIIQSAITNSLKPGQSGPRFTRTELSRGPPQLRYMLRPRGHGRPCRCKGNNCTIL